MLPRAAAFVAVIVSGLAGLAAAAPARAEGGPVIAIPTRPGVPVVINGRDASYAVVEGDWGLYRPGAVPITVIGDAPLQPNYVYQQRSAYHPKFGHAPPSGRNEVEPPPDHPLPEPAESYYRSWSTSSDAAPPANQSPPQWRPVQPYERPGIDTVPPTINDPQPYDPPTVVVPRNLRRP